MRSCILHIIDRQIVGIAGLKVLDHRIKHREDRSEAASLGRHTVKCGAAVNGRLKLHRRRDAHGMRATVADKARLAGIVHGKGRRCDLEPAENRPAARVGRVCEVANAVTNALHLDRQHAAATGIGLGTCLDGQLVSAGGKIAGLLKSAFRQAQLHIADVDIAKVLIILGPLFLDDHHPRRAHRIVGRPCQLLAAGNLFLLLLDLASEVGKGLDRLFVEDLRAYLHVSTSRSHPCLDLDGFEQGPENLACC